MFFCCFLFICVALFIRERRTRVWRQPDLTDDHVFNRRGLAAIAGIPRTAGVSQELRGTIFSAVRLAELVHQRSRRAVLTIDNFEELVPPRRLDEVLVGLT